MKNIIASVTFAVMATSAFAQDTLRTNEYDVIKDFKPTLTDIIKIASNPNPEVPEVKAPKLEYTLPETRFNPEATIYTIKPLAMGTALLPKLKNNYFRLGYGNYNSPLMEAYVNTVRNKTSQAGVYVKHFSASPSDNNKRSFSDNIVKLWGKRFFSKGMISNEVAYNRNVINYFGYQPQSLDIPKANLRRQYAALDINASYSNIIKDTAKLKYNVDAAFYNFVDNNDIKENNFKVNGTFDKRINGNPLKIVAAVNTNNTSFKDVQYNRLFVDFNPEYTLTFPKAFIKLGFNTTTYNDSVGTKFYPFPKVEASYQITPKTITAYGGFTGKLNRNTYRSLATENPFISNFMLNNTLNKFEVYGGFKGEISAQTSFVLQFSHATIKNMLFYGFDSTTMGQRTIYDTVNSGLTNIKAELNHEFGDRFHFNFTMNYFGYDLQLKAAYSRPSFTTRTSLMYNMSDKFIIRGDIYTFNKRTSIDLPSNQEVSLKPITDINLHIDYRYNKNVGLFLNFNNLTNNKYQRWYNYQMFGFNVLAGLSVTF